MSRPLRKPIKVAATGPRWATRSSTSAKESHEGALQRMLAGHGCLHSWERCGCRRVGAVEQGMTPRLTPSSPAAWPPHLLEPLGGGATGEVAKRARPEPEHGERAAPAILLATNIPERLRHLRAERATEARGIRGEQQPIEAHGGGDRPGIMRGAHAIPPGTRAAPGSPSSRLARAVSTSCASRSASARATRWPNAVRR